MRELRGASSLREMAEAVGIKYNAWARYEAGGAMPGAEIIIKICRAHACSADWLLGLNVQSSSRGDAPQMDWKARARTAEAKLERVNRALGHALRGFEELQEAMR